MANNLNREDIEEFLDELSEMLANIEDYPHRNPDAKQYTTIEYYIMLTRCYTKIKLLEDKIYG